MHQGVPTEIADLTRKPHVLSAGGIDYVCVPNGWRKDLALEDAPGAITLPFATLTGLKDYLYANRDGLALLPKAALFEADGGAWRLAAMETIGRWLRAAVPPALVVLV